MRKTLLLMMLAMLLVVGIAAAETCFTAVNVPQSNNYFWRAITYTDIVDGNYANYFTKPATISGTPTLGTGYQFQMRTESNCFDGYLLTNNDMTGAISSQLAISRRDEDLLASTWYNGKIYTLSIGEPNGRSTKLVNQISTGTINGINYLNLPSSFNDNLKHQGMQAIIASGLCDRTLTIANQMDQIREKVWTILDPTDAALTCTQQNIIDCAIDQGKGRSQEYSALIMVLARKCGVPTRVVSGISEGQFDGVDIVFPKEKIAYWVEYWDNAWYDLPAMESGVTMPEAIEFNCIDGKDNDANAYTDCWDRACAEDYACSSWPVTTMFKNNVSTDIAMLPNPYDINDLILGNSMGSVSWVNQHIDLRGQRLDSIVQISSNLISISNSSVLNKPATATLNLNMPAIGILKDNVPCNASCQIKSSTAMQVVFTIPGAGRYSAQFANVSVNASALPPAPAPAQDLPTRIWTRIKDFYNKRSTLEKVVGLVLIVGVLYLIFRPKRYYPRY